MYLEQREPGEKKIKKMNICKYAKHFLLDLKFWQFH